MRNYIKKGGHGGSRRGAGRKAVHWEPWEDQDDRAAAAAAKKKSVENAATASARRWEEMGFAASKAPKVQSAPDCAAVVSKH